MREQGELTMTQIAEELSISPASLYRRLAHHRQETEIAEGSTRSPATSSCDAVTTSAYF